VAECGGLENRWARKGPGGSNPSSSAIPETLIEAQDQVIDSFSDEGAAARSSRAVLRPGVGVMRNPT
jgi:hypothetical protein